MEKPYIFDFGEADGVRSERLHSMPDWCTYSLAFARNREYYRSPQFEILSQQLNHQPFFIELIEARFKESARIPFVVHKRQLFLYFTLSGRLLFTTVEGRPIIVTHPGTFQMSIYEVGQALVHVGKGKHIVLIVSIWPEWIEEMSAENPNLQKILKQFKEGDRPSEAMYQVRMDRRIRRWLHKIYTYSEQNIGAVDGNLRTYISYVLEYYGGSKETHDDNLAYQAKVYMDAHYLDPAMNVKFLADHFSVTERTLLNRFKKQYNIGVHDYYSALRAKHALRLMEEQGLSTKDIYLQVGYSDESSLRYAINRYLSGK